MGGGLREGGGGGGAGEGVAGDDSIYAGPPVEEKFTCLCPATASNIPGAPDGAVNIGTHCVLVFNIICKY